MFSIYNYLFTLPTVRDVYLSGKYLQSISLKMNAEKVFRKKEARML